MAGMTPQHQGTTNASVACNRLDIGRPVENVANNHRLRVTVHRGFTCNCCLEPSPTEPDPSPTAFVDGWKVVVEIVHV